MKRKINWQNLGIVLVVLWYLGSICFIVTHNLPFVLLVYWLSPLLAVLIICLWHLIIEEAEG